jgi:hypothetical protein
MKNTSIIQLNGVTFEVCHDTGESPQQLATKIAEALNLQGYYIRQAASFREQSNNERKKAQERTLLLFNLREYNRNKRRDKNAGIARKVSRMEPMEFYDENKITEERKMLLDRANEFHKTADNFLMLADKEKNKVIALEKELSDLRSEQ